jgi:hypothetical protein
MKVPLRRLQHTRGVVPIMQLVRPSLVVGQLELTSGESVAVVAVSTAIVAVVVVATAVVVATGGVVVVVTIATVVVVVGVVTENTPL